MAHNAGGALQQKVADEKLAAIWEFQASPLFTPAERVALEFAVAAAAQPNAVTDELFDRLKQHWSENQIVEIVSVISFFGFMNRYNDTMATPLEDEPIAVAQKHLRKQGWELGKHGR
jgi:alkylhydroperoxidase family enzyme